MLRNHWEVGAAIGRVGGSCTQIGNFRKPPVSNSFLQALELETSTELWSLRKL